MDHVSESGRRSRLTLRHRHQAQDFHQLVGLDEVIDKEGDLLLQTSLTSSSPRVPGPRTVMAKDHRMFHRRAPQAPTKVLTVNVQVIATLDTEGNVLAQATLTQADSVFSTTAVTPPLSVPTVPVAPVILVAPDQSAVALASVPSVPQLPTHTPLAVPTVPSVPPFPSDLTVPQVPSYPWPSGVSGQIPATGTWMLASSHARVSAAAFSEPSTSLASSLSRASTSLGATTATASMSITSSGTATLLTSSATDSAASSPPDSSFSGNARTSSPTSATNGPGASGTLPAGGVGPGAPVAPTATSQSSTGSASSDSDSTPLETPKVVGSVVGSLAGAALILALILFLLRRHKRKLNGGPLQLTDDDTSPPMTHTQPRISLVPSAFLHRFSGMSRSTAETSTSGGERSFQRVSGRKLPSAFSEGMHSNQFARGGTLSGSSFYQDDYGTYGGPGSPNKEYGGLGGLSKEFGRDYDREIGDTTLASVPPPMNMRPGPARTPIIRHPDDAVYTNRPQFSPPHSPNPEFPRSTLGRSLSSADGSRSSRFTENV